MSEWKPIETCPITPFCSKEWFLDHSARVLLCTSTEYGTHIYIGAYGFTQRGKGRWLDHWSRVAQPTHWMELPEPPK